jgi:hypothetical protein
MVRNSRFFITADALVERARLAPWFIAISSGERIVVQCLLPPHPDLLSPGEGTDRKHLSKDDAPTQAAVLNLDLPEPEGRARHSVRAAAFDFASRSLANTGRANSQETANDSPSPGGEGWGEGERSNQSFLHARRALPPYPVQGNNSRASAARGISSRGRGQG